MRNRVEETDDCNENNDVEEDDNRLQHHYSRPSLSSSSSSSSNLANASYDSSKTKKNSSYYDMNNSPNYPIIQKEFFSLIQELKDSSRHYQQNLHSIIETLINITTTALTSFSGATTTIPSYCKDRQYSSKTSTLTSQSLPTSNYYDDDDTHHDSLQNYNNDYWNIVHTTPHTILSDPYLSRKHYDEMPSTMIAVIESVVAALDEDYTSSLDLITQAVAQTERYIVSLTHKISDIQSKQVKQKNEFEEDLEKLVEESTHLHNELTHTKNDYNVLKKNNEMLSLKLGDYKIQLQEKLQKKSLVLCVKNNVVSINYPKTTSILFDNKESNDNNYQEIITFDEFEKYLDQYLENEKKKEQHSDQYNSTFNDINLLKLKCYSFWKQIELKTIGTFKKKNEVIASISSCEYNNHENDKLSRLWQSSNVLETGRSNTDIVINEDEQQIHDTVIEQLKQKVQHLQIEIDSVHHERDMIATVANERLSTFNNDITVFILAETQRRQSKSLHDHDDIMKFLLNELSHGTQKLLKEAITYDYSPSVVDEKSSPHENENSSRRDTTRKRLYRYRLQNYNLNKSEILSKKNNIQPENIYSEGGFPVTLPFLKRSVSIKPLTRLHSIHH